MPARHFYSLRHHIFFSIKFLLFCALAPEEELVFKSWMGIRGLPRRLWSEFRRATEQNQTYLSFYSKKTPTSKVGGELRLLPT